LVLSLYEKARPIFRFEEALEILGTGRNATQQILFTLVRRGILTRLKPGLFQIVPFDLGFEKEHLGNPSVVARELALSHSSLKDTDYYLSHASALSLHQMSTQPQLVHYTTTPLMIRPRTILGAEFRFVRCQRHHLFGTQELWVAKTEKVRVSDKERTILDGLKQPEYCGGISEVTKGLWMKREVIDPIKLVGYALRLNIGAVTRRLGFLMEICHIDYPKGLEKLQKKITATYQLLDPSLPTEGKFTSRWKLRLNITEEELRQVART